MPRPATTDGTPLVARQQLILGRAPFQNVVGASEDLAISGINTSSDLIWDGDASGWTLEAQGTAETYAQHSGTYGLDSGSRTVGQATRFSSGANQDIGGSYDTVSFWMQPKAFKVNSSLDILWKTLAGGTPGTRLSVNDYVSNFDLDTWQKVTIPIDDFALGADVAKLELVYADQGPQPFYFDEFSLNSGGDGPQTFRVSSPTGQIWHVERLIIVIAAGEAGWDSGSFGDIASGLPNGFLLKYHKIGVETETYWTLNCRTNVELFGNYNISRDVAFADNEIMVVLSLEPVLSSVILVDDDEVLDLIVRDDLSNLARLRAFLHFGREDVA